MTVIQTRPPTSTLTDDEYLAFIANRPSEERWELIDGVAIMMPPSTKAHQRIGSNLAFELNAHFKVHRPQLYAYQESGLLVPGVERFRPHADVAVEDNPATYDNYTDTFYLVVEVLSDSNRAKEVEIKRTRYMQNADNNYVLIISQKEVLVQAWARAKASGPGPERLSIDGWQLVELRRLDERLDLPEFAFSTSLRTIYDGTPLTAR